jgi:hypothetical protein
MTMREVRVYGSPFPTHEQIRSGDPNTVFPKESWLQHMHPGEFAVRYKDFKTGHARNPTGEPVQSSEICHIFDSLEEAREDSKRVTAEHWAVRCFIYDCTGLQVEAVSNNRQLNKFAAVTYTGILLWVGMFTFAGMGFLRLLYSATLYILRPSASVHSPLFFSGWLGWIAYAFAGFLSGVLAWLLGTWFSANRKISRMTRKAIVSPEEKKRFAELNALCGSKDQGERERFLKLENEYREKVREAIKK